MPSPAVTRRLARPPRRRAACPLRDPGRPGARRPRPTSQPPPFTPAATPGVFRAMQVRRESPRGASQGEGVLLDHPAPVAQDETVRDECLRGDTRPGVDPLLRARRGGQGAGRRSEVDRDHTGASHEPGEAWNAPPPRRTDAQPALVLPLDHSPATPTAYILHPGAPSAAEHSAAPPARTTSGRPAIWPTPAWRPPPAPGHPPLPGGGRAKNRKGGRSQRGVGSGEWAQCRNGPGTEDLTDGRLGTI